MAASIPAFRPDFSIPNGGQEPASRRQRTGSGYISTHQNVQEDFYPGPRPHKPIKVTDSTLTLISHETASATNPIKLASQFIDDNFPYIDARGNRIQSEELNLSSLETAIQHNTAPRFLITLIGILIQPDLGVPHSPKLAFNILIIAAKRGIQTARTLLHLCRRQGFHGADSVLNWSQEGSRDLCRFTTIEGFTALSRVLNIDSRISQLVLPRIETILGILTLSEALCRNRFIQELSIALTENSSLVLLKAENILKENTALRHLDISFTGCEQSNEHDILLALRFNSTLKSLSLSKRWLDRQQFVTQDQLNAGSARSIIAESLKAALEANHSLESLSLSRIGESNLSSIVKSALSTHISLTSFRLCYIPQDKKGISALFKALMVNPHLRLLDLTGSLPTEAWRQTSTPNKLFEKNTTLRTLIIDDNSFPLGSLTGFITGIALSRLTACSMNSCMLTSEDGMHLSTSLTKNSRLCRLSLKGNYLGDAALSSFAKLLFTHPSLAYLNLTGQKNPENLLFRASNKTLNNFYTLLSTTKNPVKVKLHLEKEEDQLAFFISRNIRHRSLKDRLFKELEQHA